MFLVGQLSKMTNISIRTLHYYDEIGLLKPSAKAATGYRLYTKENLIRLQQILAIKKLGFSLSQIKEMLHEDEGGSKKERWKQIFEMEINKVQEEKKRLDDLEKSLYAIRNSLLLKGDLDAEEVLLLIHSIQNNHEGRFLRTHFTKKEEQIIKEQLPSLVSEDDKAKEWLELLGDIRMASGEPVESAISQQLANRLMTFLSRDVHMEDSLLDKYWETIKPKQDPSAKVLGLDKETMDYMEKILYWYEHHREGDDGVEGAE